MIRITNTEFITSAAVKSQFISSDKPIIAVCGKSNVGKSSFINKLGNRKKLAKVSKEPGRTRLVNYFDFGEFILADLPGYGYARVCKDEKLKWAKMLTDFFAEKDKIAHVFCLTDIRHDPTADDLDMTKFLYYHLIPFSVVATKADKLSKAQQIKSVNNIANIYKCGKDNILATSSENGFGFDRVLQKLTEIVENFYAPNSSDDADNVQNDNSAELKVSHKIENLQGGQVDSENAVINGEKSDRADSENAEIIKGSQPEKGEKAKKILNAEAKDA